MHKGETNLQLFLGTAQIFLFLYSGTKSHKNSLKSILYEDSKMGAAIFEPFLLLKLL
jgi:hypothetical protein